MLASKEATQQPRKKQASNRVRKQASIYAGKCATKKQESKPAIWKNA